MCRLLQLLQQRSYSGRHAVNESRIANASVFVLYYLQFFFRYSSLLATVAFAGLAVCWKQQCYKRRLAEREPLALPSSHASCLTS
jgi:hypothetical protein